MSSQQRALPGQRVRSQLRRYVWPPRVNKLHYLARRLRHRWTRVHLTHSPISGPISIWDLGRERHLVFSEQLVSVESVVMTHGSWRELHRELWGQAVQACRNSARPGVLILGLGGGTMVHLAFQLLNPKRVVAVEIDPLVVQLAREYMGMDAFSDLDLRVADARVAVTKLTNEEPFDLLVEDVYYRQDLVTADDAVRAYIQSLVAHLTPTGCVVFNRWPRPDTAAHTDRFVSLLNEQFARVTRRRVGQRWEVELITATGPLAPNPMDGVSTEREDRLQREPVMAGH